LARTFRPPVDASDHVISREWVVFRSVTTADPTALLLGQHLRCDAAMVGT
jgi:hypothetical protein